MHNVMMLWKEAYMPKMLLDRMNLSAEDNKFLKGMLLSISFFHNLTLNGMLFLEFDKESKVNKQAAKPEVASEEDILFQLAQMMMHLTMKTMCILRMTQITRRLLQSKMILSLNLLLYGMTINLILQLIWQWLHNSLSKPSCYQE